MKLVCFLVAAFTFLTGVALQLPTPTQSHALARSPPTRLTRSLALSAKKPNRKTEQPSDTPPKSNFLQLALTYATPWKNPNSIFIYFFLVIYGIDFFGLGPPPHD